jgi:N-acetyl-anhydromuramyl-L-alanine amidase AmpD
VSAKKFIINLDSLEAHKRLKVIVAPEVLTITIGHILNNITARLIDTSSEVNISWQVLSDNKTDPSTGSSWVELVASNTGTLHPPDVHKLTLSGLATIQSRLKEYGGELEVLEPVAPYTFQVLIRLQRWTETE